MTTAPFTGPADCIALFLNTLVRAVADTFPKGQQGQILLWQRLTRLGARFAAILAGAGRPRAEQSASRPPARSPGGPRPHQSPCNFALLFRQLPGYQLHRSQLQHLLQQPEMAALLQATPHLRRVLNPLCRMLRLQTLPTPGPQTRATDRTPAPANHPACHHSEAPPQRPPAPPAAPTRTRPAPLAYGPEPPSLWSVILGELGLPRHMAARAEPVPSG